MDKKHLLVSSLGNILEWFDFGLFIFFAPLIGRQFFPLHDPSSATIATFGVFAAGFICRPLGGILFGHWGDQKGRAQTLRLSISLITCSTLLVGFLPTYQTAGIVASILFVFLRLLQGLSVGGEYSGIMIYLAESAPTPKRGFFTSFAAAGANLGFLLATLLVMLLKALLPESVLDQWGWRIPFILAGFMGLVILYYRLKLLETSAYLFLKQSKCQHKRPLITALRNSPKNLLQILGLTCMGSTFYTVFFGFVPNYLSQQNRISAINVLIIESVLLAFMICIIPLAGKIGDRFGRRKILLFTATSIILLTLPCFYFLDSAYFVLIMLVLMVPTILSSMEQGNTLSTIVENCPLDIRYSGVSFSYNLGNALFGATAPLVVSFLAQSYNHFAPAYYLMGMTAVTGIVLLTMGERFQSSLLDFSFSPVVTGK
jgi:MHS family proline/betaine transporter-like MFS transporter